MTTTDKLMDAAEFRMRRGGYNAVSFRDLAGDMGIKSSSVHYHYPRKEDLGVALVERYSQRFFDALNAKSDPSDAPTQKLEAFRAVYRSALNDDGAICLCGLLGAEIDCLPEVLVQCIQTFFQANMDWIKNALPDHLADAQKDRKAAVILAGHQGAMMLATSMKDTALFDTITAQLVGAESAVN